MPLRVAHVTWGLNVGGLEKLLVEFARHADRRRVELRFFCLADRGELAGEIERHGWPVIALNEGHGLRPALALRLAQYLRRWHADVVHVHNTRALIYGGTAALLARAGRLVLTVHGQRLDGSPRERMLFRLFGRLPDRVVAVSHCAADFIAGAGIPRLRISVIPNGIDTERFAAAGPNANGPVVTVARISPEKDLATLLRAAAILRDQGEDFRLQIAGDGQELAALRALADELGLADAVQFLGQTADVPALLRQARFFVQSSLTEGISLALLEAMACGLPVVATHVGGNPEVVADGETGLLVPPQSPAKLAAAMRRLLRDTDVCRQMGQAARRRVEEHFDIRRMVRQYEDDYELGVRRPRPRRAPAVYRPSVATNLRSLTTQTDRLRVAYQPAADGEWLNALKLWLRSLDKDLLLVDQAHWVLLPLCVLRLLPFSRAKLVSLDLVLARPEASRYGRLWGMVKGCMLRRVDLFLMHLKDARPLKQHFGIDPRRLKYVPFKVNFLDAVAARGEPKEGDYIFTGGRSRRDYRTFCAALAETGYPAIIVTPDAELNAYHGTDLRNLDVPPNVRLVHDDGSPESWIDKIAGSKLAVFCISPETISPSGVGAYLLAMALKKCVIISDCPATRGILQDNENAVLVPMCDPAAVAEAIRKAWQNDAFRRRIAEGGYRYAHSLGGDETLARNVAAALAEYWSQC